MANNITGSEKQALGASLITDGAQFPAKFLPSAISFVRNELDVSHSQTVGFKATKPEELAEPFTLQGIFFFDARLLPLVELMKTEGALTKRQIHLMFPYMTLPSGSAQEENGFVYAPEGFLAIDGIDFDINDTMKANFTFKGGTVSPVIEEQKVIAGNVPTSVVITEVQYTAASLVAGSVVATLSNTQVSHGPTIYFGLAGTDIADYYIDGRFLKSVGTPSSGAVSLTVSSAGYTAWDQDITASQLADESIGFTLV